MVTRMIKGVLWYGKIGLMILFAYSGLNIPDLVANSKRPDPHLLTEDGIILNFPPPDMRDLPPMGEPLTLFGDQKIPLVK